LQRLVVQMPLHIYAELAEAREQAAARGGGRQATTPMPQAQTLTHEFRAPGRRGSTTMHDGHVLVAAHRNPSVEIGEDVR
jgi:hypothetical protein